MGEALAARAEEHRQLVHFNNVVSSFLSVVGEGGKTTRNTQALIAELSDDAFAALPDRGPDGATGGRRGRIEYQTGEALSELGGRIGTTPDVPVLKASQVNALLGGRGRDPAAGADDGEDPALLEAHGRGAGDGPADPGAAATEAEP